MHILVFQNSLKYTLSCSPHAPSFQVTKSSLAKVAEMQDRLTEAHERYAEASKKLKAAEDSRNKMEFDLQISKVMNVLILLVRSISSLCRPTKVHTLSQKLFARYHVAPHFHG